MRKLIFICFGSIALAFLIISCANKKTGGSEKAILADSSLAFSISTTTIDDFTKAKKAYQDQLIQDTLSLKKVNGVTELPLKKPHYPQSIIFRDTLVGIGEGDEREYHYLGYFPKVDKYLVSGTFWENYECYVVDKNSGNITTIWNNPTLSPTAKYFANLSLPYGLEGLPNGIQIWKIESSNENSLSKYLELDQQIWIPIDFVWETDNAILLKVCSVEEYLQENKKDYTYLRLQLK